MIVHAFLIVTFTVLVLVKTSEHKPELPREEDACKVKTIIKSQPLEYKVICEDGRELVNE